MNDGVINGLEYFGVPSNRRDDFHFQMIKLRLPGKYCNDLASYNEFRKKSLFTDLVMIMRGGEKLELHSLAIVGKSVLLETWMNTVRLPEPLMTIHAPDFDTSVAKDLLEILYGQDLYTTPKRFNKVKGLAEALGISLSLNERSPTLSNDPLDTGDILRPANVLKASTNIPLCCWHCSKLFSNPEVMEMHLRKHDGEPIVKKTHKCPKCKKILPSMWKFRQHLITHKSIMNERLSSRQDHQYAGPIPVATKRPVQRGDHIYAEAVNEENQDQTSEIEGVKSLQVFEGSVTYPLKEAHTQPRSDHNYTEQNSTSEDESCPLPRSSDHMYAESPNKNLEVEFTKSHTLDQRQTRSSGHKTKQFRLEVKRGHEYSGSPQKRLPRSIQNKPAINHDTGMKIDHLYAVRSKSKRLSASMYPSISSKQAATENIRNESVSNSNSESPTANHELAFVGPVNTDLFSSEEKKGDVLIDPASETESQSLVQPQGESMDSSAAEGKFPSFECKECSKSFTQRYRLSRHVREVHEKVRPYKCRYCSKRFFKPFSLQRHELVHVSHSLWVCPNTKCNKKFRDQSSLTYHTRKQVCHKNRGSKT